MATPTNTNAAWINSDQQGNIRVDRAFKSLVAVPHGAWYPIQLGTLGSDSVWLHLDTSLSASFDATTKVRNNEQYCVGISFDSGANYDMIYDGPGPFDFKGLLIPMPGNTLITQVGIYPYSSAATAPTNVNMWIGSTSTVIAPNVTNELHPDHEEAPEEPFMVDDEKHIDFLVMKKLAKLGLIEGDTGDDSDDDWDWDGDDGEFPFARHVDSELASPPPPPVETSSAPEVDDPKPE